MGANNANLVFAFTTACMRPSPDVCAACTGAPLPCACSVATTSRHNVFISQKVACTNSVWPAWQVVV